MSVSVELLNSDPAVGRVTAVHSSRVPKLIQIIGHSISKQIRLPIAGWEEHRCRGIVCAL